MTQLPQFGDQLNMNMPESIASLFHRQTTAPPPTANESGAASRENTDTSDGTEEPPAAHQPLVTHPPIDDQLPSPITIPRAHIAKGTRHYLVGYTVLIF